MHASFPHIGDSARIDNERMAASHSNKCHNVHVLRNERSAWNNHALMKKILQTLRDSLAHRPDVQAVLILDVAPCHIHKSVLREALDLGIWLVFVPASITCLLQPLDTHMGYSLSKVGCAASMQNYMVRRRMGWYPGVSG